LGIAEKILQFRVLEGFLLLGETSYLDIAPGQDHIAPIFIHANTFKRYGRPKAVHCEIWYKGKKLDAANWSKLKKSNKNWWKKSTPITGRLLPKENTPFMFDLEYQSLILNLEK